MGKKKEKSELEGRKYWKEKAERLQKENIELRKRLDAYELALNIWSRGQSELIMGKNYEPQFENGQPKYKSDLYYYFIPMETKIMQHIKQKRKEKKKKKSEGEYRYIKIPMIFDGRLVYNYCTIMDYMETTTEKQENFFKTL